MTKTPHDHPPHGDEALTSKEVIHFYAGWCGKVLCAVGGSPISSIKADQVTCEACKTMLMPARLLQPCVIDGDELAKIEDGWGDPAGTYLKYRGQVWINDGWLDNSKVRALRDWLNSVLSGDSSAPETRTPVRVYAANVIGDAFMLVDPTRLADAEERNLELWVPYEDVKPLPSANGCSQETPRELTLLDFGYAPGKYTFTCHDCAQPSIGDKRSLRCETCAAKRLGSIESSGKASVQPNAHCNGCGADYIATDSHICPATTWNIASRSQKNDIAYKAGLIRLSAFDSDLPCWHELPLDWRKKLSQNGKGDGT